MNKLNYLENSSSKTCGLRGLELPSVISICEVDITPAPSQSIEDAISNSVAQKLSELVVTKKRRPRYRKRRADKKRQASLDLIANWGFNGTLPEDGVPAPDDCEESDLANPFSIKAITNQTTSRVFRIKTGFRQHIKVPNTSKFQYPPRSKPLKFPLKRNAAGNVSLSKNNSKLTIKNGSSKHKNYAQGKLKLNENLQSNSATQAPKQKKKRNKGKNRKLQPFPDYMSVREVQEGLECGELIKGTIRINTKNFKEGYVSNDNTAVQDYLIESVLDRNRALEGDVVVLKLKPQAEWREKNKTARVVYIEEKVHSRIAVGFVHLPSENRQKFVFFLPRDHRVPRIRIPFTCCPTEFQENEKAFADYLFQARICNWTTVKYAQGTAMQTIGEAGDLQAETKALVLENDLNTVPFNDALLEGVPTLHENFARELEYRKDFRGECIFTIDPLTAKDLDDAVSCQELPNGNFKIGVHISDVAYFLAENTPLDERVSKTATSTYLVDKVRHMLPKELCMSCSLLPGADKFTFSVFWEITPDAEILAYEHAQMMIENPQRVYEPGELPVIHNGYSADDLNRTVNNLQKIALILRENRFKNGSLRIDQPKIMFDLDRETGQPVGWSVYVNKEAHRLIEEFMLLANMTVARKILDQYPEVAFLRRHPPPKLHMLEELQTVMEGIGIHLDISSSGALHDSLMKYQPTDYVGLTRMRALNLLLAKPMQRALYFCAGAFHSSDDFLHYALHIPIYTHFTSPIRRYADIMVHRLLAASLGYTKKPDWEPSYVMKIAENCNLRKYQAKKAENASIDLYFAMYVQSNQPFVLDAVVFDVRDNSFDVIVVATGTVVRMFLNDFDESLKLEKFENQKKFVVNFPETSTPCTIELFSLVHVALRLKAKTNKLEAKLMPPVTTGVFTNSTKDT